MQIHSSAHQVQPYAVKAQLTVRFQLQAVKIVNIYYFINVSLLQTDQCKGIMEVKTHAEMQSPGWTAASLLQIIR